MKGVSLAQTATSCTDSMYLELIELQELCSKLLTEVDSLKVENEILKVIAGE